MSRFTNYGENQVIDFFRGEGITLPDDWHIGLLSAATDAAVTEIVGSDYGRQPVARSLTTWAGTQGAGTTLASTGTSHATSNNEEIDFGAGIEGSANFFGLFDAETGGNCWAYIPLASPMVIDIGDPVSFSAGTLVMTLGVSGGLSDYAANKLIDLIFRGQSYAWPATTYAGYSTTMPTNAVAGAEPLGGYARVGIASTLDDWSGTNGTGSTAPSTGTSGRMANIDAITAPQPTASQGDVVAAMLFDAATLGNMLFWAPLPSPVTVNAGGNAPRWEADQFGVTVG